jgi:hypothetical protein
LLLLLLVAIQAALANAASITKGSAPTYDIVVISHARDIDPELGLNASLDKIGITGDRFAAISTAPMPKCFPMTPSWITFMARVIVTHCP